MEKSQEKIRRVASKLPDTPGVYKFVGKKNEILYIGKATALKSRVKSYFSKDLGDKRGPLISNMMAEALNIKFEKTDSVLEALILEAELIKKFQPRFNSIGKDQKSWNYVVITDEKFPRVLLVREKEITPLAPLTLRGESEGNNDIKMAKEYLEKSMATIYKGEIPELYYSDSDRPNENVPLGWAESLFIVALLKSGK